MSRCKLAFLYSWTEFLCLSLAASAATSLLGRLPHSVFQIMVSWIISFKLIGGVQSLHGRHFFSCSGGGVFHYFPPLMQFLTALDHSPVDLGGEGTWQTSVRGLEVSKICAVGRCLPTELKIPPVELRCFWKSHMRERERPLCESLLEGGWVGNQHKN